MISSEARYILCQEGFESRAIVRTEDLARQLAQKLGMELSSGGKNWLLYFPGQARTRIRICGLVRFEKRGNFPGQRNPWGAVSGSYRPTWIREHMDEFCSIARKVFGMAT